MQEKINVYEFYDIEIVRDWPTERAWCLYILYMYLLNFFTDLRFNFYKKKICDTFNCFLLIVSYISWTTEDAERRNIYGVSLYLCFTLIFY